ncbi:putative serine/threonine-protein kinase [Porphyridium purpureum]|uniref:Putative serine/threonine-protein kinase n=1 Tax=Porphyridium purpureum TaxID=35688 RepID=A0A5J4YUE5_PORPP|nr:putative serine/threonine-protein kinase [Porphyridium purpureum]|eukprot:POR2956..scf229_5
MEYTGASGKTWRLKKKNELRSGVVQGSPYASEVAVVRDADTKAVYVLKTQSALYDAGFMESLVDEAATWRKIGIAAPNGWPPHLAQLVDVFLDRAKNQVSYLVEFCANGHVQRRGSSQNDILKVTDQLCDALSAVHAANVPAHGNVAYSTVLLDEKGTLKLLGFGGGRKVCLDASAEAPSPALDVRAIGALIYEMVTSQPAPRRGNVSLPADASSVLSPDAVQLTNMMLASSPDMRPTLNQVKMAVRNLLAGLPSGLQGAEGAASAAPQKVQRAKSVLDAVRQSTQAEAGGAGAGTTAAAPANLDKSKSLRNLVAGSAAPQRNKAPQPQQPSVFQSGGVASSFGPGVTSFSGGFGGTGDTESLVIRATEPDGQMFTAASLKWLSADFERDAEQASRAVFKALFKRPCSRDPVISLKALALTHFLILNGPVAFLSEALKQDKFLEWIQGAWSAEAFQDASVASAPNAASFSSGEIGLYAAFLRMKTRFHFRCQNSLSGTYALLDARWIEGRERKLISGVVELLQTCEELATALMFGGGACAVYKHGAMRMVAMDTARAYEAVCVLVDGMENVKHLEKVQSVFEQCHAHAHATLNAARKNASVLSGPDIPRDLITNIPQDAPDIVAIAESRNGGKTSKAQPQQQQAPYMSQHPGMPMPAPSYAGASPGGMPSMPMPTHSQMGNNSINAGQPAKPQMPDSEEEESFMEASKKKKKDTKSKKKKKKHEKAENDSDSDGGDDHDKFFDPNTSVAGVGASNGGGELPPVGADGAGALVLHGTNLQGQLIDIPQEAPAPAPMGPMRANPDATNEDLLAEALGLDPAAAEAARMLALPPPPRGEDDDGESGEDEEAANQPRGGWRSSQAMQLAIVQAQNNPSVEKSHPVFCQCAMCTTAEVIQHKFLLTEHGEAPEVIGARIDMSKKASREYKIDPKLLKVQDKLGEGSFGTVYKGRLKNKNVAVKILNRKLIKDKQVIKDFKAEVNILCQLDHPNVIKCYGVCTQPPNYMVVTEFMPRGTLFDVLHKGQMQFNWVLTKRVVLDIVRGMAYIHASNLLHRDLKSSNLLLDSDFNTKISDFGLVHYFDPESTSSVVGPTGHAGTYQYMAPEIIQHEASTEKSDVYSFSIVLWEILARKLPYLGMDPTLVADQVAANQLRPPIMPFFPQPLAVLMSACWSAAPDRRPSFVEIEQIVLKLPGGGGRGSR